eukprot:TRINITY_DN53085_c0_g1_i1.p1 TRINITY_DN53085_c0_g1~~TRINITY_DN53085_c0_g1_i1.p1  ORF type:complete len:521 (-),score=59.37 TRINITY_DN53085_c0_g1_i1:215-1693(-)
MLTNFARMGMELTDTSMVGHLNGGVYLSSVSYSQIVIMSVMVIVQRGMGGNVVSSLCATAYGAGNYKLIGLWAQIAAAWCALISILLMPTWIWGGNILTAVVGNDHIDDATVERINLFLRISIVWMLPMCWISCLNSFLLSQKIVYPQMFMMLSGLLMNLGTNALFIYGFGWGYVGSPIATSCSRWFVFLGLLAIVNCTSFVQLAPGAWTRCSRPKELFEGVRMKMYLSQALPSALTGVVEEYQLQTVAVFAGKIGPEAVSTHNATLVLFLFLCGTMWAISAATSTRIGHHLGRGDQTALKRVITLASVASATWGLLVSVLLTTLRQCAGELYSSKAEVDELTAEIYTLVGPAFFLMSIFYVSMSVLTASFRQIWIVSSFVIGAWGVSVPLAYALSFRLDATILNFWPGRVSWDTGPGGEGLGLLGIWMGLAVGYAVTTSLALVGVCRSDWPTIIVQAAQRSQARDGLQNLTGDVGTSQAVDELGTSMQTCS